ncbi:MAG: hypothetical protein ABI920_14880 [Casimicrobiaceae bacterium]
MWRYAWTSPATLVGLLAGAVACACGARARCVDGVLEIAGGRLARALARFPSARPFVAVTLGHVILGIDHSVLADCRAHEHVHVRQYERWGMAFLPLYFGESLVQWLRGRDPYRDNRFERAARCPRQPHR